MQKEQLIKNYEKLMEEYLFLKSHRDFSISLEKIGHIELSQNPKIQGQLFLEWDRKKVWNKIKKMHVKNRFLADLYPEITKTKDGLIRA